MIEMVDNSWGVHRRWSLNRYNNRFPWEVGEVGELVESTFSYHQNKYTRHHIRPANKHYSMRGGETKDDKLELS